MEELVLRGTGQTEAVLVVRDQVDEHLDGRVWVVRGPASRDRVACESRVARDTHPNPNPYP